MHLALPLTSTTNVINELYERGHSIVLHTARGSATGIDWQAETMRQLRRWGVKFHDIVFGKPAAEDETNKSAGLLPQWLHSAQRYAIQVSAAGC